MISDEGLLVAMQSSIAGAMREHSATALSGLLGDLQLGLRVLSASRGHPDAPDSIATERTALARLPQTPPLPESFLPSAKDAGFADCLRKRLGMPALRIDRIDPLSGGFSRATIALSYTNGTASGSIILRKEVLGGLLEGIGASIAEEYPLLVFAKSGGVPTPAPLWLETDPNIIGGAFIAMERASGECLGTAIAAAENVPQGHLRSLASMLARLHSLDWRRASPALPARLGFAGSEVTAADALDDLQKRWQRYRRAAVNSASPVLDAAYDWLQANQPAAPSTPCITHGDVGFHNIMGDARGFTGLLDWEMASLASPAKDLAHIRPSIAPYIDWPTFLNWYAEAGGRSVSAAEIKWFEVFRAFSMTLVCQVAIAKLAQPETARLEYLKLGYLAQPVFFDQLLTLIEAQDR